MTERESMLPASTPSAEPSSQRPRLRKRKFFIFGFLLAIPPIALILGFYFFINSARFEGIVRQQLITTLEDATGGRVEIATFHWQPLHMEGDAGGLVIHGLEDAGEAPYAQVDHLRVRLSLRYFWNPRILLRSLIVDHPALHLIVYPDGSTNQPKPRKQRKKGGSALDALFNLRAGYVLVQKGVLHYDNRASGFDFQDRYIPFNFDASDFTLLVNYVPARFWTPKPAGLESYHIEAGAMDLTLARGSERNPHPPVHGYFQVTADLTRKALYLRSLRITSEARAVKGHALEVTGELDDFAHPHWKGKVQGELDMKLLDPVFGYSYAPEGIARLDLDSAGAGTEFHADGSIQIDNGSYIGTGVYATGIHLDAHVHADSKRLLITSVVARLRQGGQLEGEVDLAPWLPPFSSTQKAQPAGKRLPRETVIASTVGGDRDTLRAPTRPFIIPMTGKVTARFKNVSLDTILGMVCSPPFQRLGLDSRINGLAIANWTNGVAENVSVGSILILTAPAKVLPGEVPAAGSLDATYTQRDGAVALRKLEVYTPASHLQAHGQLGAYPTTSPSALTVDFHSGNLNDFDTVLRGLGVNRNGRSGVAALPVALAGQADFDGSWSGSLVNPHIAGSIKATQLSVAMLTGHPQPVQNPSQQAAQPNFIRFDSVEAKGSYAADRIVLSHGLLRRGNSEITVDGSLSAATQRVPAFDSNSQLHLHLQAGKVSLGDLLPLTNWNLPITDSGSSSLDAQIQLDGPIHSLDGSGWVELNKFSTYGEPVDRIRAQGTITNQVVKLSSVTLNGPAGSIAATGSFNLNSRQMQVDARSSSIDLAKIEALRRQQLPATGRVSFSLQGSGTSTDPRLEVHASLSSLALGGEPLGAVEFTAHTTNRALNYNATSHLQGAELKLSGQTVLSGEYSTQAKLDFSDFNIGTLVKMANVPGLTGESALAGTISLDGPLARPAQLRGEARLEQLTATVAGVHLASQGSVHATLNDGRINLDPLHITGEETDLHVQGSLSLLDKKQLDFAAGGSVNLKLAETLDADLTAKGTTTFKIEAHGPLDNPGLRGSINFENASLSLEDIPNGLSQLHGTLEFSQNRLEVKSLTAMSGGGLLTVNGYLAYQHGLYADLSVNGKDIRIRYPQGVSSLADATFHLQGPQNNMLLSGDVLITRFTVSPELDIAALVAQANSVEAIAPPSAPSNHIRLDVHIVSSPQLNFQNAFAKLAGNVDVRLRGTVASPSLLGRISITEGSAMIAGTRYELQRGDIYFTNPVRIQPNIDINATARVEDYDITLGLHGTPDKLSVTYHSDPPLPEADVVALLALGRTESQQRIYTQQQVQSVANPTTDSLLGGALNATVSSRVQKLFGAGSVKVDPNYIGALGNSTSRIIVEEQLGRNVTLTYATDVDTTGQQLIQAEVALNRHVSLLVARDESGVFSMVVKATRRFR
jgi:translocation and assembly module TamB